MPTADSLAIRIMTPADIPVAMQVKELAGWNQLPGDWERLIAWEPEGCFVAEWEGEAAGTATTTRYGDCFGWVGMMLVHPDMRRRGIGKALLVACIDYLRAAGVETVKLDATPMGRLLYETLGFVEEHMVERHIIACEPRCEMPGVDEMTGDHFDSLCSLDEEAFGADRRRVLERLHGDDGTRSYVVVGEGGVDGYGFVRPGANADYFGPWVARCPEVASKLLDRVIWDNAGRNLLADISLRNSQVPCIARHRRLKRQRHLFRMYLGENACPGDPELVYGIAGPEIG